MTKYPNEVLIVSSTRDDDDDTTNYVRHRQMCSLLEGFGVSYSDARGFFEGAQEYSVMIPITLNLHANVLRMAKALRAQFQQECALYIKEGDGYLVYPDSTMQHIGKAYLTTVQPIGYDYTKVLPGNNATPYYISCLH